MSLRPQAEIFRRDASIWGHRRGFGHHQAGPTGGQGTEMDQLPVVGEAIDTAVLAHWAHPRTITESRSAEG